MGILASAVVTTAPIEPAMRRFLVFMKSILSVQHALFSRIQPVITRPQVLFVMKG
jgi:hypothetical protein